MTTEIYQFDCKLYDQDFILWLETTINHLQNRQCRKKSGVAELRYDFYLAQRRKESTQRMAVSYPDSATPKI